MDKVEKFMQKLTSSSSTSIKNDSEFTMRWEPYLLNVVDKKKNPVKKLERDILPHKSINVRQPDYSSAFPNLMRIEVYPVLPKESTSSAASAATPKESSSVDIDRTASGSIPKDSACVVIDGTALELQDTITISCPRREIITVDPTNIIVPPPPQEAQSSGGRVSGSK